MRSLVLIAISGVAFLTASCGSQTVPNAVSGAAALPAAPAAPEHASPAEPPDTSLVVSGPIIVEHQIELTAQRDGLLLRVFLDAPARVKSGDLLAQLDDRQLLANLEAARAKTRSIQADLKNWQAETEVLKSDYVRAQRLWDLGLISEEQLLHAKFKAESDQWDVQRVSEMFNTSRHEERSLELELEKTRVAAPFDGLVARRYVREGQNVAKGDRLFWVTAESPLLMRFTLPEKYFGHLHQAQPFEVTSADLPGQKHAARIKQLSPVVDPSSGTFDVLLEFVGDRGPFRPGMTANVRLDTLR
jgi:membrane fusion protein, multidrug efflux system